MSEHAWSQENLAAYVADGLDAAERERLEGHVRDCPDCARALAELIATDRSLEALFAGARPGAALEDRMTWALRQTSARATRWRWSSWAVTAAGVAAAVMLAGIGAGVTALLDQELLQPPAQAMNNLRQLRMSQSINDERSDGTYFGFLPAKKDPLLSVDINPSAAEFDTDIHYMLDNKAKVSVPGQVNSDDAIGIPDGEKNAPPTNLPHPGAFGDTAVYNLNTLDQLLKGKGWMKSPGYFKPGNAFSIVHPQGQSTPLQPPGYFEPGSAFSNAGTVPAPVPPATPPTSSSSRQTTPPPEVKVEEKREGEKLPLTPEKVPAEAQPPAQRVILRTGELEFTVESFDAAVAEISRQVAAIRGAFVATVNSEKLPNGKVRGSVVVRVPPEPLDEFVVALRRELGKTGELKHQRVGSQDITKQYTDLESRLKAARTMEDRLLRVIKEGKGEIKDLLQVEKELGNWRTRVEELEGELRYYANRAALSTLTITLAEKEIRQAAAVVESERVQAGVEVEDVEKALRAAQDAIQEAKGRITKSELKQHDAGQFNAQLHFEVPAAEAGPMRDRLRQLGNVVRLEVDRVLQTRGGEKLPPDGKVERGPTQFFVSLYNLANVAPREVVTLKVAALDVPAAYQQLRAALAKAQAKINAAQLNEQDPRKVTAQLAFDVRQADEALVKAALDRAGDVLSRQAARRPAGDNVTDAKIGFQLELVAATTIEPRETVTLAVEVADVDQALSVLAAQVKEVRGRVVQAQLGQERGGRMTARVTYDVPLAAAPGLIEMARKAGQVRAQRVTRHPQAPEGRLAVARLDLLLSNGELLVPRDEGLLAQVRHGVSLSLRGLAVSAGWLIVGVLFVLPWLLLLYAVYWLGRRLWRGPVPPAGESRPA